MPPGDQVMIRKAFTLVIVAMLALSVFGQKKYKPYSEWTEKDAQKILNDSPWGHTQVETDTSEMFFNPTANPTVGSTSNDGDRVARGATNQSVSVNYRVRFLTAKPIREALSRLIEFGQKAPDAQVSSQLKRFVEGTPGDYIIVTVTFDTKDPRFANTPRQAFAAAVLGTLKTNTYLDRDDGKRLFLSDYRPQSNDGLGVKFVFVRNFEGQPFLNPDSSHVRFYSEVAKTIKIDQRFKVSDMVYNGKLEY
jgi:hypothetical protein